MNGLATLKRSKSEKPEVTVRIGVQERTENSRILIHAKTPNHERYICPVLAFSYSLDVHFNYTSELMA